MTDNWNPFSSLNNSSTLDVELLKNEVGKRFPFYDIRTGRDTVAFFCRIDKENLEDNFDSLRKSLGEKGFIPMLRYEKGEHIIYIIKKPERKKKSFWINIILLIATFITTILTGSLLNMEQTDIYELYEASKLIDIFLPDNLINGTILFAFPLMSILFIHEMGHYFISKKYRLYTSLPYFMPIPPVLPGFNIGTFGALISSGDPMPNKKALFDIGISGPLAGFIIAIPITIIGIITADLAEIVPIDQIPEGEVVYGSSLLIDFLINVVRDLPKGYTIEMNPLLFAGWVGFLITSINLLPAGQLDGGHIFRAALGEKQKYAGWIAVIIMVITGWVFFAIIIVFIMGMMHPPPLNDDTKLDNKRKVLSVLALSILIACFIPTPIMIF